jgi:hypothetical protein
VARRYRNERWKWGAAIVAGALSAGLLLAMPGLARAEGFFDFLFGGSHDRWSPPRANAYAEPSAPVSPPPLGPESVRGGGGGSGRAVSFCVRLCDGRSFPIEHIVNATPIETCRAMCPASKTKVFFGTDLGQAAARDGQRYGDLDSAFVYRKQVVANCTCNGRDAFGLAPFELTNDPTLRPGDIVITANGPVAYAGQRGSTATFTPVNPATLEAELHPAASPRVRVTRTEAAPAVDDPGTIVPPPQQAPRRELPTGVDLGASGH